MSFKDTVLMILNELVMKKRYKFMYPCFDLNTKSDAFKKQTNKPQILICTAKVAELVNF